MRMLTDVLDECRRDCESLRAQLATVTAELAVAYECPLCAFADNSAERAKDGCPNCGVGVALKRVSWRDRGIDLHARAERAEQQMADLKAEVDRRGRVIDYLWNASDGPAIETVEKILAREAER